MLFVNEKNNSLKDQENNFTSYIKGWHTSFNLVSHSAIILGKAFFLHYVYNCCFSLYQFDVDLPIDM